MYKYSYLIFLIVGSLGTAKCSDDIQLGEKKEVPRKDNLELSGMQNGQKKDVLVFPAGTTQNGNKKDNNNGQDQIERPCRVSDLACIQHYFEKHSHCKPAHGIGSKSLRRAISNQFYPVTNVTQINLNDKVTGLNTGRIQEFYINRKTDKLVLGVEFQGLTRESKNTFLKFYRKAKEPIVTHGYTRLTFNSLYITVTIPQIKNLRLDKADISGTTNDVEPISEISPSLIESSDPIVSLAYADYLANFPIAISEFLLTESPFYGAAYIQHYICDFGLQLI